MGVPEATCKLVGRWSSDAWKVYCKNGRSIRQSDMRTVAKAVVASISVKESTILVEERDCRVSWG